MSTIKYLERPGKRSERTKSIFPGFPPRQPGQRRHQNGSRRKPEHPKPGNNHLSAGQGRCNGGTGGPNFPKDIGVLNGARCLDRFPHQVDPEEVNDSRNCAAVSKNELTGRFDTGSTHFQQFQA